MRAIHLRWPSCSSVFRDVSRTVPLLKSVLGLFVVEETHDSSSSEFPTATKRDVDR
jgi:hypothetical protein